jgi:hypothetical protein
MTKKISWIVEEWRKGIEMNLSGWHFAEDVDCFEVEKVDLSLVVRWKRQLRKF